MVWLMFLGLLSIKYMLLVTWMGWSLVYYIDWLIAFMLVFYLRGKLEFHISVEMACKRVIHYVYKLASF